MTATIDRLRELEARATQQHPLPWTTRAPSGDFRARITSKSGIVLWCDGQDASREVVVEAVNALPALLACAEALGAILGEFDTPERDGDPMHSHGVAGVWDASNGPPLGGTECAQCAAWKSGRAALAALDKEEGRDNG